MVSYVENHYYGGRYQRGGGLQRGFRGGGRPYFRGNWRGRGNINAQRGGYQRGGYQRGGNQRGGHQRGRHQRGGHQEGGPQRGDPGNLPGQGICGINRNQRRAIASVLSRDMPQEEQRLLHRTLMNVMMGARATSQNQEQPNEQPNGQPNEQPHEQPNEQPNEEEPAN